MKPRDLIADLRVMGPPSPALLLELGVALHFFAERAPMARLENGSRIVDAIDVREWLEQLAKAAREASGS